MRTTSPGTVRAAPAGTVPVYEWHLPDGTWTGIGTALEFWYWSREGVNNASEKLTRIVGYEPISEDASRMAAWGLDAADVPASLIHPADQTPVAMSQAIARELAEQGQAQ